MLNDGSALDRLYRQNAERILLQSVAASPNLTAAALGYAVWWISAIGQENIQRRIRPLLGVLDELAIIDVICFGPPLRPSYKRWKKPLDQIMSWDRLSPANLMTHAQIDEWVRTTRHAPGPGVTAWSSRGRPGSSAGSRWCGTTCGAPSSR